MQLFMITFYICNRIQERTRPPPFCCLCCYNRIHPPAGFESVVVAGARDPREASASSSTTQRLSRTGRRSHSRTSFGSEAQRTGGSSAGPNNEAWHALEAAGSAAAGVAAPYSPENDVMMFEQDMSFDAAAAELMLISDPRRQALAMDNTGGRSRRVNSNGDAGLGWSSSSSSSGSMAGSVGRSSSNLAGGGWTGADGKGVYDGSSGGKVWATASGSPHGSRPGSAEFRASSPRYMPSSSGSTVSEV